MDAQEKRQSTCSGLFLVVVGLGCLVYFGWVYSQQSAAKSWPTVPATVVTSHIEQDTTVSARRGVRDHYRACIEYQYTVGGAVYTGTDLWFDSEPESTNRLDMEKLTAEYAIGKTINVYYDPEEPQSAVVIPEKNATLVKCAMAGGVLSLIIGALLAWNGVRSTTAVESPLTGSARPRHPGDAPPTAHPCNRPTPPRPRHWLVRTLAGLIGFPVLLVFGAVTVLSFQKCLGGAERNVSLAAQIVATFISGGITLFGFWLAAISLRNRRSSAVRLRS
jgi:hypothetical protein